MLNDNPGEFDAAGAKGLSRRDLMLWTGALGLGSVLPSLAFGQVTPQQAVQTALGEGRPFDSNLLTELARILARRPFVAPPSDLPEPFNGLNYEQYVGIRARPNAIVWSGEGRGFSIEPLHRGFAFSGGVGLYVVEDGTVRRVSYDRNKFDFGRLQLPQNIGDLGFSGFRIFASNGPDAGREVALFQGATFFRAVANGQNFGVTSRALAIRPADARGEEFPIFRAFWIERPRAGHGALVIHALIDSESVTGTVRFTLRPGDVTIMDVESSLFPRVALDHVGLGSMTTTFLFGPQSRRLEGDIRPAVYESTGLQTANGRGEWVWRPLTNPDTLQISVFDDERPRGFGLLQRDRDFTTFHDDDQRFERRPSLWAEPLGDWGQGSVQLIEIPSDSEVNDNVIAYWRPRVALMPGTEFSYALRQFWCWTPPDRPPLAIVARTRTGAIADNRRRFFVDFVGEKLGDAGFMASVQPILSGRPGNITNVRQLSYPERNMMRVSFDLDPGSNSLVELRLLLESAGKPASETWLYRWTI